MVRSLVCLGSAVLFFSALMFAQAGSAVVPRRPTKIFSVNELGAKVRFARRNRMSPNSKSALMTEAAAQPAIRSIPHWSGSFTYNGQSYPYVMAGGAPRAGGRTRIGTDLIPISMIFDGFIDENGNNIVLDVTRDVFRVLNGPDFEVAPYDSGYTQFGDAVQRAEFWGVKRHRWQTWLESPRLLKAVQLEVPANDAALYQLPDGTILALVDSDFFVSQLNTITQLEPLHVSRLAIALSPDVMLYQGGNPNNCCILGFHTAYDVDTAGANASVQTFIWASWLDPGIFLDSTVADVLPISHELSETLNDPFINNVVPPWQNPDGSGTCGGNLLEVADPVEVLSSPNGYPVMINGYLYHPQNMALLQWFTRKKPSDAVEQAYSFPDTTLLTTPSQACAAGSVVGSGSGDGGGGLGPGAGGH